AVASLIDLLHFEHSNSCQGASFWVADIDPRCCLTVIQVSCARGHGVDAEHVQQDHCLEDTIINGHTQSIGQTCDLLTHLMPSLCFVDLSHILDQIYNDLR